MPQSHRGRPIRPAPRGIEREDRGPPRPQPPPRLPAEGRLESVRGTGAPGGEVMRARWIFGVVLTTLACTAAQAGEAPTPETAWKKARGEGKYHFLLGTFE